MVIYIESILSTIFSRILDKAKKYIKQKVDRLEEKLQPSTKTAKATERIEGDGFQKPVEWWDVQSHGKTTSEVRFKLYFEIMTIVIEHEYMYPSSMLNFAL